MVNNVFSESLAKPKDSPQHRRLREDLWLVGPAHACRYYLSVITGEDLFAVTEQEFLDRVRAYDPPESQLHSPTPRKGIPISERRA
jgi:hypothetical protein